MNDKISTSFIDDLSWSTLAALIAEMDFGHASTRPILDAIADRVGPSDDYLFCLTEAGARPQLDNAKRNVNYLLNKIAQIRVDAYRSLIAAPGKGATR